MTSKRISERNLIEFEIRSLHFIYDEEPAIQEKGKKISRNLTKNCNKLVTNTDCVGDEATGHDKEMIRSPKNTVTYFSRLSRREQNMALFLPTHYAFEEDHISRGGTGIAKDVLKDYEDAVSRPNIDEWIAKVNLEDDFSKACYLLLGNQQNLSKG